MRQTVYKCDHCTTELGEKTHISLSFSNYSGIAFKPEARYWEVLKPLKGKFMHFCNSKCIGAYFKRLMDEAKGEAKGGN